MTNIGEKQEIAKSHNMLAVSAFTFAFTSEAMMAYIDKSIDTDWPTGHAGKITNALFKKFNLEDIISKAKICKEIMVLRMGENEDLSNIFMAMTSIEVRYKQPMSVEEKLSVLLKICPKIYKTTITAE